METDYTELQIALETGHLDNMVKYLFLNRPSDGRRYAYAVNRAASHGHLELLKYLIDIHPRIYQRIYADDRDMLPLINYINYATRLAAYSGHLEVIRYLVEKGADVHSSNNYAIRWANENGHYHVMQFFQSITKTEDREGEPINNFATVTDPPSI